MVLVSSPFGGRNGEEISPRDSSPEMIAGHFLAAYDHSGDGKDFVWNKVLK